MGTVTQLKDRTRPPQKPQEAPRPYNLPRVYDPPMFVLPVALGAAMFAAGFAAGAVWMGWWR